MVNLVHRIRELETQLDNIQRMTVSQRIGCSLQRICSAHRYDHAGFELPISKTTLALRVGIALETLSRSVIKLPKIGISITGRKIKIDTAKTKKTICGECTGTEHCKAFRILHGGYKDN